MSTVDGDFGETCGARADGCICVRDPHDYGEPHRCGIPMIDTPCNAQWLGTWGHDDFRPVIFPGGDPA